VRAGMVRLFITWLDGVAADERHIEDSRLVASHGHGHQIRHLFVTRDDERRFAAWRRLLAHAFGRDARSDRCGFGQLLGVRESLNGSPQGRATSWPGRKRRLDGFWSPPRMSRILCEKTARNENPARVRAHPTATRNVKIP
jgi:hypothetical protein